VNIPKEQNMQAKWLKVDPRWLRYGGVLEDSFFADYMSLISKGFNSLPPIRTIINF
jgi:hypothetical protein